MTWKRNREGNALKEKVRMSDPLQRMRRERRVALLLFNLLLLVTALIQLLGYAMQERPKVAPPPPIQMELMQ